MLSSRSFLPKEKLREFLKIHRQKILKISCFDEFFSHYEQAFTFLSAPTPKLEERRKTLKEWQADHTPVPLDPTRKQKIGQIYQEIEKVAHSLDLPVSCLATRKDIESFIRRPETDHKFLSSWRRPLLTGLFT